MGKRLKTYIVLTSITLLLVLLAAFVLYERMVASVEQAAFEVVESAMEANVDDINAILDEIERLGHTISNNAIITNFFMRDNFTNAQIIIEMNRIIMPFIAWVDTTNKPLLNSIGFITNNQNIVHNAYISPKDTHYSAGLFAYISDNHGWRNLHWESKTGDRHGQISTMYMLVGQTREIITILELSIENDNLFDRVNGLFPYNSFFVTDQSGHVIYQRGSAGLMYAVQGNQGNLLYYNGMAFHTMALNIDRLGFLITMVTPLSDIVQPVDDFRTTFITILLVTVAILVLIMAMSSRIVDLAGKNYLAEIAQKKAVIDSLQKQIQPHFIYNTIETFRMMAEINEHNELSDSLASFGSLIRYTMSHSTRLTTLGQELENLWDYIRIQNLLKNNLLELTHNIGNDMLDTPVPVLVLQPLAENAILHGYDHERKLTISVNCHISEGHIIITFGNNGKQIPTQRLEELKSTFDTGIIETTSKEDSIALANIHNRLRLQYGQEYGLNIDNTPDGVAVTIRLPAESGEMK